MNNTSTTQRYNYLITFDTPMSPQSLADHLAQVSLYDAHLLDVTDLQDTTHSYGNTYPYRRRKVAAARAMRPKQQPSFWRLLGNDLVKELKKFVQ